ncbi:MAG: hypothetical protein U0Q11_10020 [Vicinamibacterales bacterium]
MIRDALVVLTMAAGLMPALSAQDQKPVPKDSMRVIVPGCANDYVFTAVRATEDTPGGATVPEGTHFRLSGKKDLLKEIKAHEGSRMQITGLIRRGQSLGGGVAIGGARISGGSRPVAGGTGGYGGGIGSGVDRVVIDVEGWQAIPGDCPLK